MNYNLTTNVLKEWFDLYNKKYFDGIIPQYSFQIKQTKSYFGKCFAGRRLIIMSNYLDRTEHDFKNTFIHEMIHAWQWIVYRKCDHSYTFKNKAVIINKDGWNIKRCSDNNGAEPTIMKKGVVYILNFNYQNRNCFSKVSSNSSYSAYNRFKRCAGVSDVKLYRCDNSVALDKYPTITKSTRYWFGPTHGKVFGSAIESGTEIEFMTTKHTNSTHLSTCMN